ncbi:MAG: GCN5-related N-acetyltransferase [Chloroflexi bacterium]|nr:GCN5-related N-acetyltransferase [Chloroflexota bacterium]
MHQSAFSSLQLTATKNQAVIQAQTFRPELDLLLQTPERELIAFALAWYDPFNKIVMFDPVGCKTEFQRRGLTGTFRREGLRKFKGPGGNPVQQGSEKGPARL